MFQSRNRPTPRSAPRSSPTIAIGQRVFVNSPGGRSGSVVLMDVTGKYLSPVQLTDGVEVEVIAWRPRVEGDAHYRVRSPSNGADGWLPAGNLRKLLVPLAPVEAPAAKAAPMSYGGGSAFGGPRRAASPSTARQEPVPLGDGRRFGQHSEAGLAPESSPAPTMPEPAVPGGGRRFGQIN